MRLNSYLVLTPYGKSALVGEGRDQHRFLDLGTKKAITDNTVLNVFNYSLGLDQTLNIGSSGSGSGRVSFTPFSITKGIDVVSPILFQMCASGSAFNKIDLLVARSAEDSGPGTVFLQYTFKRAAVATISYAQSETFPQEVVTFEYGDLQIRYSHQQSSGSVDQALVAGWNRIKNTSDTGTDSA